MFTAPVFMHGQTVTLSHILLQNKPPPTKESSKKTSKLLNFQACGQSPV